MRSCKCKHTNTIIYRGKQHCNVSKVNIGHRTCTMYMYVRQSANVYSKDQTSNTSCKLAKSKVQNCLMLCAKGNFYGCAETNFYEFLNARPRILNLWTELRDDTQVVNKMCNITFSYYKIHTSVLCYNVIIYLTARWDDRCHGLKDIKVGPVTACVKSKWGYVSGL